MQLQKSEVLTSRWKIFVNKYSLQEKNKLIPTKLHWKSLLWSCRRILQKYDTELSKEYQENKGATLFQK